MNGSIAQWVLRTGVILFVLAFLGALGAVSGAIPIKASSGHWQVTAEFLQFAKERSVWTHTLGTKLPPLEEPWLVLKGAGHYETACRPCHGSPEFERPLIAWNMTPKPPNLSKTVPQWAPEELFYIVKHGIKFTGMPAWPALGRDDEVRAMVAFLLELPKMNGARYSQLVHGHAQAEPLQAPIEDLGDPAPPIVTTTCDRCHGERGEGRGNAAFPKLAGQTEVYLRNQLRAYAEGQRYSGIMEPLSAPLTHDQIAKLSTYYASLPPAEPGPAADPQRVERGRQIAQRGIPGQGVPSCMDCHGPRAGRRNPAYPHLAGQYADYLVLQLELFKTQHRGGSAYAHIMNNVASRLRPEQMRDVAAYYASVRPSRDE